MCSVFGKAHLIKSIIFGKISYYAELLPIDIRTCKKIDKIIRTALWNSRPKISSALCQLPIDEGGLGIPHTLLWQNCRYINWLSRRLTETSAPWPKLLNALSAQKYPRGGDIIDLFLRSPKTVPRRLPAPWPNILASWKTLDGGLRDPQFFEDVLDQPLWNNAFFDRTPEELNLLRPLKHHSICYLADLWSTQNQTWSCPLSRADIVENDLALTTLVETIGSDWLALPNAPPDHSPSSDNIGIPTPSHNLQPPLSKFAWKTTYNAKLSGWIKVPTKYKEMLQTTTERGRCRFPGVTFWPAKMSERPHRKAAETLWLGRLNALATGRFLTFAEISDPNVTKCNACPMSTQSHAHLFGECHTARMAWRVLVAFGYKLWPRKFECLSSTLDWENIRWGIPCKATAKIIACWNVLTTLMWRAIWNARCLTKFEGIAFSTEGILAVFKKLTEAWLTAIVNNAPSKPALEKLLSLWGKSPETWTISGNNPAKAHIAPDWQRHLDGPWLLFV